MEQNKSLGLLSLARKGGNIVLGEEQAGAAARASRARLMLLASDAGGHTVRRAKSFVAGTAQPLLTLPYTRDELGDALGTTSCAIAAITDVQLALAFAILTVACTDCKCVAGPGWQHVPHGFYGVKPPDLSLRGGQRPTWQSHAIACEFAEAFL